MSYTAPQIWAVIAALAVGTFLIRFSFLGLIGNRQLPGWALKLLRYTPVAVLPGLVAPMVIWPAGVTGLSLPHLVAAGITVAVGRCTRSVPWALIAGSAAFAALRYLVS